MAQGLPEPPDLGASALPPGTYEGATVFVTGAGTGLGKAIAQEFSRLGASIVIASRKPEHLADGQAAIEGIGGKVLTVGVRHPRPRADRRRLRDGDANLRAAATSSSTTRPPISPCLPRTCRPTPGARSSTSPSTARSSAPANSPAATSPPAHRDRSSTSALPTRGRAGPGFAHSAAAKAGVKNMVETLAVEWGPYGIQVNGLVPGLFPHEDMTADIKGNLSRTNDKDVCQPALRVGRLRELGWAATFLASPYARFISGHTLVVDGANWQRRTLTNPPVVTVRDQMGKGPFEL